MYLACSSESYGADLDSGQMAIADWFRLCAEDLGLGAVEVEDRHIGTPTPARLAEVRAAADQYGLEIVNIAFMNNFGLADAARRADEHRRTVTWMDASKTLQTGFLRTFAGWPEGNRLERWPEMIASLRATAKEAERRRVRLVMENHNHGGFVQTADDVETIFGAVASPALGLLLDTGNFVDGATSVERTVSRAWHVHAKFTRVLSDGRDARVGHDAVIPMLRTAGYAGCVAVEYEGDEAGATAVPRALRYLRTLITTQRCTCDHRQ
jgi:sugar phosphate isomerase/epimerase